MGQWMTALRAWWAIRPWRRRPEQMSTAVANFPLPPLTPEPPPVVIAQCPRCGVTHTKGFFACDGLRSPDAVPDWVRHWPTPLRDLYRQQAKTPALTLTGDWREQALAEYPTIIDKLAHEAALKMAMHGVVHLVVDDGVIIIREDGSATYLAHEQGDTDGSRDT